MRDFKPSKDNILYIGITKDEERRKTDNPNIKYPLIEWGWTGEKCKQYLREKKMLNPLYEKGFGRLGCWLCPKQRKESLRVLYENYPHQWKLLKKLEADCPHGFHPDYKLIDLEKEWTEQTKLKR